MCMRLLQDSTPQASGAALMASMCCISVLKILPMVEEGQPDRVVSPKMSPVESHHRKATISQSVR